MKSKIEQHEVLLSELSHHTNELKITVRLLGEKMGVVTQKYEGMKPCFSAIEDRLHVLETFMQASIQRMTFIKTFFKFWPALLMTLFFFFAVGIFVDDQKVATEIANKMELKIP